MILFDYNMSELAPTGRWCIRRKLGRSKIAESPALEWQDYLYIEAREVNGSMRKWYSDTDLNLLKVND